MTTEDLALTHMTLADAPVADYHSNYSAPRKSGTSTARQRTDWYVTRRDTIFCQSSTVTRRGSTPA
jgi:hypothetical protein